MINISKQASFIFANSNIFLLILRIQNQIITFSISILREQITAKRGSKLVGQFMWYAWN